MSDTLFVSVSGQVGSFPVAAEFTAGGGVTALFGESGAGKTTLLKMIAGVTRPKQGRITIRDHVLFDSANGINLPPEQRRIGYVFQDARLFPHLSVKTNLTYARWAGRRSEGLPYDRVVALLGLEHLQQRSPTTLSGGERQRVAIGRALLSNPSLLLMDEPLSSLDHNRRQEILPFLETLRDETGLPILYVSHEIDEVARLADEIVLLQAGRVTASGPAETIFSRLGSHDDAGALVSGTVTASDDAFGLTSIDIGGHPFQIAKLGFADGTKLRLRIRARDVSIARALPEAISIRNILPARIVFITTNDGPDCDLTLDIGGQTISARLTRKSASELALKQGDTVFALVKAASVDRGVLRG
ncbi:molybdenum ABC transporter ATP-binding protein [Phyllobacterium sp. OV277]|uniref:molybdenum ABC transporter ATP-binding protein n=1 Tax=Phyllobacterium sp. OV277 TaxID=1882772 RepID=UPI00088FEC99|nr:molybdenum ABC transporter ATP-binding protein [Phyllobacterium sp. OV277]SDO15933.1 molybdate transport system ATP-binding protein [Phyllobacterium sp. OV277]